MTKSRQSWSERMEGIKARRTGTDLLEGPSEKDLGGGHVVRLGELLDNGVVESESSDERSPSLVGAQRDGRVR